MKKLNLLTINPGSTSTKIAVYRDHQSVFDEVLRHSFEELSQFSNVVEQLDFRKELVLKSLRTRGIEIRLFDAVVGRGGLLRPVPGGTYMVNQEMIDDLISGRRGNHASNLGAIIANSISRDYRIPAFVVDPVSVDELQSVARFSGMPENPRISLFHALNQKAVARVMAAKLKNEYSKLNLIVAHLGGGISVGAHVGGRVIDVNNVIIGEGPMSPERAGTVPTGKLVEMCYSGQYSEAEMKKKLTGSGGLVAYLETTNGAQIEKRIEQGDHMARLVYEAMAYQISKEIGASSAVLKGAVDAIALTGGLAYSKMLVDWITERISHLAPVYVFPGEMEMQALAEGALRVLNGEEEALQYGKKDRRTYKIHGRRKHTNVEKYRVNI